MQKLFLNVVTWVKRQFDGSCLIREVSGEEEIASRAKRPWLAKALQGSIFVMLLVGAFVVDRSYCGCGLFPLSPFLIPPNIFRLIFILILTFYIMSLKSLLPRIPLLFSWLGFAVFLWACYAGGCNLGTWLSGVHVVVAIGSFLLSVFLFLLLLVAPLNLAFAVWLMRQSAPVQSFRATMKLFFPFLKSLKATFPIGSLPYLIQVGLFSWVFLMNREGAATFFDIAVTIGHPFIIVLAMRRLKTVFPRLSCLIIVLLVGIINIPHANQPEPGDCLCEQVFIYHYSESQETFHKLLSVALLLLPGVIPAPKRNVRKDA